MRQPLVLPASMQCPVSRRDFLKRSLAAAGTLLLSEQGWARRPRASGPRVIVIGAGLSGLVCAFELQRAGATVHVLEARRRVGGRVCSGTLDGTPIERGGELINSQHALWGAYAQRFGLELGVVDGQAEGQRVLLDGRVLDAAETTQLAEEVVQVCILMNDIAVEISAAVPWGHPQAVAYDRVSVAEWLDRQELRGPTRRYLHSWFDGLNGVSTPRQSLLAQLASVAGSGVEEYWSEAAGMRCLSGNQRLAEHLAAGLGDSLHLAAAVSRLRLHPGHAEVHSAAGVFEGDAVVLAIPPSLWPSLDCEPALPAHLAPQMGMAVKYAVAGTTPFWDIASTVTDGPVSNTWPSQGNGALMCFSGGSAAEVCRGWSDAERDDRYAAAVGPLFSKYPRPPAASAFMDWPSEPFTRGGYSFPAPGQVTGLGPLLHGCHHGMHFAGEHTWYPFLGYMEGALQSGAAVARRISAGALAR